MSALPAEKTNPLEDAPYLACKHFLFEKGSFQEGGAEVPEGAGLCESPIGPIDSLDCPLWIGQTCRFFEERTEDPVALDDDALAVARDGLREQYLRWRYRERVRRLAADGVDPELIDVTELDPAEDARREAERRERNETKAKEQGKKKRRRRRRKKKSPEGAPDAAAADGAESAAPSEAAAPDSNGEAPPAGPGESVSSKLPEQPEPAQPPEPPTADAPPDAPGE